MPVHPLFHIEFMSSGKRQHIKVSCILYYLNSLTMTQIKTQKDGTRRDADNFMGHSKPEISGFL